MNKIAIFGGALVIMLLSIGLGAAACTPATIGCTRTVTSSIAEGTPVSLSAPLLTDEGRTIEWEWHLYNCNGIDLNSLYMTSASNTARVFDFYAPPAGDYYVGLTVRDAGFKDTCHDTKTLCFTTTCSGVTLCCGYLCDADVWPGATTTACPWYFHYDGPLANYRFSWYVDGDLVKQGTGAANAWYRIDWTNGASAATYTELPSTVHTITTGEHEVTFVKERPDGASWVVVPECPASCSCSGTPAITGCKVYIVPQPVATITGP